MTTSSLYPTHTDNRKVPQSNREFQTQIQPQRTGRFSNGLQRAPIGRLVKMLVILYTLDGVSITPSHYKDAAVLPNSVAREEENSYSV